MGKVNIHGAEYPIQKIFNDDFVFTIPQYQRPYAWTTEQAEEAKILLDSQRCVTFRPYYSIDRCKYMDPINNREATTISHE